MNDAKHSPFAIVYKDEQFFFKEKRHNVPNLLRLGFLACKHQSVEEQQTELWHLINPKLEETIAKSLLEVFLYELCYVAIDMNISNIQSC